MLIPIQLVEALIHTCDSTVDKVFDLQVLDLTLPELLLTGWLVYFIIYGTGLLFRHIPVRHQTISAG